jgi:hypothetical protein
VKGPLRAKCGLALASVAEAAPLWSVCVAKPAGATSHSTAPAALCKKLHGIFSDGPDPDADPVGYALSQIKPLSAVHTSDHAASTVLTKLVAADRALYTSNGSDPAAKEEIKKADAQVNKSCPGVAS